jgi:GR25 family glycosyltransferase involved in LPS biosynthesis
LSRVIPVIVISLVRSTDRRAAMAPHLASLGIPFQFFDAIDGSTLTADQVRAACRRPNPRRYGQYLLPAEVGCIASFHTVCERIARGGDEFVCVLEDDITIDPRATVFLDPATLRKLPRFDILRIQQGSAQWLPVDTLGPFTIRAPYRPRYGMQAQIFARSGAAKLASALAIPWMPCDMMAYCDGLVRNLCILEIDPPLALHPPEDTAQTTIDPDGVRPGDAERRKSASLRQRWRRTAYEYAARLRVLRNFISQWGLLALLRLER